MSKFIRSILCFLGFHRWKEYPSVTQVREHGFAECEHCHKTRPI